MKTSTVLDQRARPIIEYKLDWQALIVNILHPDYNPQRQTTLTQTLFIWVHAFSGFDEQFCGCLQSLVILSFLSYSTVPLNLFLCFLVRSTMAKPNASSPNYGSRNLQCLKEKYFQ
jgi:hypothetical protein